MARYPKDAAKVAFLMVVVADCRYWLEQMPRLGLDPDVLSFNAVIDACARAGEVDRAEDDHWNHSRVTQ